jgi:Tfp pilus assembly protein PilF
MEKYSPHVRKRIKSWRNVWSHLLLFLSWARFKAVISALASNLARIASLAILIVVASLIVQDLSRDLIIIEPIPVPKAISDNGLTAEIASRRVRDTLGSYAYRAGSMMKGPLVSPQSELVDIVVPKIGLSLDAIVSTIRSLLHYGTRQTVSGEIVIRDEHAWLRLRVDGQEVYSSPVGRDLERVDEMFVDAAPALMEKIRPYLVASTIYDEDREEGFKRANSIVARLPESNIDVEWAYILIGNYYAETKDYARGKEAFLKAIWINGNNALAHNNRGTAFLEEEELELAEVEFRRAIKLDPNFALAHLNLGRVYLEQGELDKAAAQYRRAIELDPKNAGMHSVLGNLLRKQGKVDEAAAEYQRAFALDPKNAYAHASFGSVLREQVKIDEATREFQRAIELDPKNANLHSALGFILYEQGEFNEAAEECQRAIEFDPKNATLHAMVVFYTNNASLTRQPQNTGARLNSIRKTQRCTLALAFFCTNKARMTRLPRSSSARLNSIRTTHFRAPILASFCTNKARMRRLPKNTGARLNSLRKTPVLTPERWIGSYRTM